MRFLTNLGQTLWQNLWRNLRNRWYDATITHRLNRIYSKEDSQLDPVIAHLQALTLERNISPEDILFDVPQHTTEAARQADQNVFAETKNTPHLD